jgi:hypothetical protein
LLLGDLPKGTAKGFMCFRIPERKGEAIPRGILELIFQKDRLVKYSIGIK